MGAAVEDLPTGALDEDDPDYPLLVTAVVRRRIISGAATGL
jgi:hypothetical protein